VGPAALSFLEISLHTMRGFPGGMRVELWGQMPLSAGVDTFGCVGECHCLVWRQMPFVVEANAIVWCGGKCLLLWRQMPLFGVEANAFCCGGKCHLLWRQMPLCVEAIKFDVLSLLRHGQSLDTLRIIPPLLTTLPGFRSLEHARRRDSTPQQNTCQDYGSKARPASTRKHNARAGVGKARAGRRPSRARAREARAWHSQARTVK